MKKNKLNSKKIVAILSCSAVLGTVGVLANSNQIHTVLAEDNSSITSAQTAVDSAKRASDEAQIQYDNNKTNQNSQILVGRQADYARAAASLKLEQAKEGLNKEQNALTISQQDLYRKQEINNNTQSNDGSTDTQKQKAKNDYDIALLKHSAAQEAVNLASAKKIMAEQQVDYVKIDLNLQDKEHLSSMTRQQEKQQAVIDLATVNYNIANAELNKKHVEINLENNDKESIAAADSQFKPDPKLAEIHDNMRAIFQERLNLQSEQENIEQTLEGYRQEKNNAEKQLEYFEPQNSNVYHSSYNPISVPTTPTLSATRVIKYFQSVGVLQWKFENGEMTPSTEYLYNGDKVDLTGEVKILDDVKYVHLANESGLWIQEQYLKSPSEVKEESLSTVLTAGNVTYSIFLRDSEGKMTEQMIQPETSWKVFAKKTFYGHTYYRIGTDQQWIEDTYVTSIEK